MKKTEVQLFDNEYKTSCDTFGCGESAASMVGRPDAPLSTALNLCAICTEQLVRSVVQKYNLHEKAAHGYRTEVVGVAGGIQTTVSAEEINGDTIVSMINQTDERIQIEAQKITLESNVDFDKATVTGLNGPEKEEFIAPVDDELEQQNVDDEPEVTLEQILEGVRSHAELDEIAKELGIKGLPTRETTKLDGRKEYILNYEFPDVE